MTTTDGHVPVGTLLAEPLLRGTLLAGRDGLGRGVGWCLPLSETRRYGEEHDTDLAGVAVHLPVTALAAPDEAAALIAGLARRASSPTWWRRRTRPTRRASRCWPCRRRPTTGR
ncbi:hypothetical protein [Actinomadura sp. BRA 177]|uniref:hypothetical protein n=1 Tax=Actinomadura sp. BRA 177 TaxID=2745202 RepID=UPI0015950AF3|nr:hypothetical protein [Actinomadura sp. BRA 177]NVI85790.1 hypothetical protein [Actinomadura sp. BRA 177]